MANCPLNCYKSSVEYFRYFLCSLRLGGRPTENTLVA